MAIKMVISSFLAPPRPCCPDSWTYLRESCYIFVSQNVTYDDAENFCKLREAYVAAIETEAEQKFIMRILEYLIMKDPWISLTDDGRENVWFWKGTGKPMGYQYWMVDQPNGDQSINNVIITRCPTCLFRWADRPRTELHEFICERSSSKQTPVANNVIG